MDETSSRVALIVPAPAADPDHAQPPAEPPAEEAQQAKRRTAALTVACASRVFVIALMASSVAPMAWRARHDLVELAVVAGPCALLAALFVVAHRAERLTPESPPGERRRLHVAAWVLGTLIVYLSAYQISRLLPAKSAIAVWFVMCVLLPAGILIVLRLRRHEQYQEMDGDDCDAAAGDGKDKDFHGEDLV
ncbi:unnamed protein product [Urochloa decumbens]|uniref:Uncharacterized protein n=1 Tax=Urochloa decumbens TaxID=240449 RepID=A0ABC8W4V6_9POAL